MPHSLLSFIVLWFMWYCSQRFGIIVRYFYYVFVDVVDLTSAILLLSTFGDIPIRLSLYLYYVLVYADIRDLNFILFAFSNFW